MILSAVLALSNFLATTSALPTTPIDDTPLPLLIWHGLGDNYAADGIASVAELAEKTNPGTFVYPIHIGKDASSDRSASFFGNLTEQLQLVCDDLASHNILSTAPAVNAIGFSQGGQFLRGYIERCNFPPVRNLVTFGSQHTGISEFQSCGISDWLCHSAMALLRTNAWGGFVQSRLVPAQYYRTLDPETGRPTEEYLERSNFLADVNNERSEKNKSYAENLAKLKKFIMYVFEDDKTVVPKESGWFAEVRTNKTASDEEERIVVELRNTTLYKDDFLGLKSLDRKGALVFRTHPGEHMRLEDDVLEEVFKEYFGPVTEDLLRQDRLAEPWEDQTEPLVVEEL